MSSGADRRAEMLGLTRRALTHFRNGTTDQAAEVMRMPVAAYLEKGGIAARARLAAPSAKASVLPSSLGKAGSP